MAAPTSFRPLLEKYCLGLKPKLILEWGPGESTLQMAKLCPDAHIISIEHQKKWYDVWVEKTKELKVEVLLIEEPEEGPMYNYTNPIGGKFDLIFVDGRKRVKCLRRALDLISKDGVVILHDAERGEYQEGVDLYNVKDHGDGTVVLVPKSKDTLAPVKE